MVSPMEGFGRIDRSREGLADEVYRRIVDGLIQGTLQPGDRLVMDRLAQELDVSRTPVREALQRLHAENVIEPAGRRGFMVRSTTEAEIHQLYEARSAIEGQAAAIVAGRSESLAEVRRTLARVTAKPLTSTQECFEANRAIHRAVVEATGNDHLLSFFDAVWGRARGAQVFHDFIVAGPYETFVSEHEELIDVLAAGGAERARTSMIDHINGGLARSPASETTQAGAG
jgi:DNA-binding GntR family transcriptional regulator